MRQARIVAAFAIVGALGAGAGTVEAFAVASVGHAAKVNVSLVEFKLTPSAKRVAAGRIFFAVRDAGKIPHEFVVLRTKTPAGKLATKGSQAVETGKVGKTSSLNPGQAKTLTLTLKPGHYALICNLPGHYKAGQFADLTVR